MPAISGIPDSCAQGLESSLAVPINHCFPFCVAVSIMSFHSLSIWLASHSTEQASEPGDPEALGSAIQPNIPLLNVCKRGIPCAAATPPFPLMARADLQSCRCWCCNELRTSSQPRSREVPSRRPVNFSST